MTRNRKRQQGNFLMPVALIGLTVTLSLSALMNHSMVLEEIAVENRLAEMRSYWAVMGHFRYAMSRTHHSYLCPVSCLGNQSDATKVTVLQNYLNEVTALKTYSYPEEAAGYTIKIDLTAAVDDDPARHNFSGHLMISSSYPTSGVSTLEILSGLPDRFLPYQLRFCAGLALASSTCGAIGNNNGGSATAYYSVKRLYRRNSVS